MGKSKAVILSAMVALSGFTFSGLSHAAGDASSFDLKETTEDFRVFKIGDVVPDLYLTKPYEITNWSQRHLPVPDADSFWTYMGGDYVQVSRTDKKVLRIMSGDIFYQH
ncbi:RcnB family protein [Shimwellia pseudoproteus]|uniref:RcnB family protein n=1 Tax=Shimwellia pseudoproteus TaxID=570012 RepID=UPI0018EAF69D|nr:RcnB family protein [Shimwellia pseudoproteus]MBJ3815384.1 RcnB family protein [Shimwellia pseudoproteus]